MTPLWFGGEDIDFPNTLIQPTTSTTAGVFRSGYARCAIRQGTTSSAAARSNAFVGGAVTSCWFRFQVYSATLRVSNLWAGLVKDGTTSAGLYIGTGSASNAKLTLWTYDGTTKAVLLGESGTSIVGGTLYRVDVQLVNYGATAVVNVYLNGIPLISFTGDTTVTGVTSLSAAAVGPLDAGSVALVSEVGVADADTRLSPGIVTGAPTGAGTTTDFSNNSAGTVNLTTYTDANPAFSNTANQVQEWNVTDLPTGNYTIDAVRVAARVAASPTSALTHVQLGYNDGGTVSLSANQTPTAPYTTIERLDLLNPNGSVAWDPSIMNALQAAVKSIT